MTQCKTEENSPDSWLESPLPKERLLVLLRDEKAPAALPRAPAAAAADETAPRPEVSRMVETMISFLARVSCCKRTGPPKSCVFDERVKPMDPLSSSKASLSSEAAADEEGGLFRQMPSSSPLADAGMGARRLRRYTCTCILTSITCKDFDK